MNNWMLFYKAKESVFSKNYKFNLRMKQEKALGVLPRLNRRFAPMVGQNALYFLNYKFCNDIKIVSYFQI